MTPKFTPGPWKFEQMEGFDALHKLKGTTPEPHEGYFRSNSGDWAVGYEGGRICLVDFKGKAKRGMGYIAPDPEGMANAHLIAAAPEIYEALQLVAEAFVLYSDDRGEIGRRVIAALAKADGKGGAA